MMTELLRVYALTGATVIDGQGILISISISERKKCSLKQK